MVVLQHMNTKHFVARRPRTFRIIPDAVFFEGMGRALDLGATMQSFNKEEGELETDSRALFSDWQAIGDDLRLTIQTYGLGKTTGENSK